MALQPWLTGKVIRIKNETHNTKRFWIQVAELSSFDFTPGQFVTFDLPIHERPGKRLRSYSIASWPDGSNILELVIVLLESGSGSNYLFNEVNEGSELKLRGPQGVFVLPEKIETDLFFICTGTGIAPFRSMVHHILNNKIEHRSIYLLFGCRRLMDTLYEQELKELESKVSSFTYLPVFSREEPAVNGKSLRTGYVHAVYEEICLANRMIVPGSMEKSNKPAAFYLCGWKNMVDEARQRILALGYDKKSIHQELYG
jgi:ferredoxin-NADP reductase